MICKECGEECEIHVLNESFDHEFGTEKIILYVSACCHETIMESGREVSQVQLERRHGVL